MCIICLQDTDTTFAFVEMFAGQAEATRMFRSAKFTSARLDVKYMDGDPEHQNPMDLLTDSGMATLGGVFSLEVCRPSTCIWSYF